MKQITIVGNVGKDAEIRDAGDQKVLSFSVAVNDKKKGSEKTLWFDVSLFGEKRAKGLAGYIHKGDKIAVTGDFDTHEHNGKIYLKLRADDVTLIGRTEKRNNGSDAAEPPRGSDNNTVDSEIGF